LRSTLVVADVVDLERRLLTITSKVFPEPDGPLCSTDLHYRSPQPGASSYRETTNTRLVPSSTHTETCGKTETDSPSITLQQELNGRQLTHPQANSLVLGLGHGVRS